MMLTVHEHPFASYCWKVLIALYERDVPFERHLIGDEADRAQLAELWPMAGMPVLVDDAARVTLPESTIIIEYLDRYGEAPQLVPADPAAALQTRLWDRVLDTYVMTPMQKIVGDSLRPEGRGDPQGVADARGMLDSALRTTRRPPRRRRLGRGRGLHSCRLRGRSGALLCPRRQPLGRAQPAELDPLLRCVDGTPAGCAGH